MADDKLSAPALIARGVPLERLVCHPRLPLIAGVESQRSTVHIWDLQSDPARQVGVLGGGSAPHGGSTPWDRSTLDLSWHPDRAELMVAGMGGLRRWSPSGVGPADGVSPDAAYRFVAFSSDGGTVWASPSLVDDGNQWGSSDAIDAASGAVRPAPPWDTGIALHPGGGLALLMNSDQAATLGSFTRIDDSGTGTELRLLSRALVLDADGYEPPVFSPDGSFFAVRGNFYEQSLQVFEFPSLQEVFEKTLGKFGSGWALHNIAFTADPGRLLIGTPTGTVVEIDLIRQEGVEHDVPGVDAVTALAVTAAGQVLISSAGGDLLLCHWSGATTVDLTTARARATAFLEAIAELPDDADPDEDRELVDGRQTWLAGDLATVTSAADNDPTWLQMRAAINGLISRDASEGSG